MNNEQEIQAAVQVLSEVSYLTAKSVPLTKHEIELLEGALDAVDEIIRNRDETDAIRNKLVDCFGDLMMCIMVD